MSYDDHQRTRARRLFAGAARVREIVDRIADGLVAISAVTVDDETPRDAADQPDYDADPTVCVRLQLGSGLVDREVAGALLGWVDALSKQHIGRLEHRLRLVITSEPMRSGSTSMVRVRADVDPRLVLEVWDHVATAFARRAWREKPGGDGPYPVQTELNAADLAAAAEPETGHTSQPADAR